MKNNSLNIKIIDAIKKTNRENFMLPSLKDKAYLDRAMPIGKGQTISQPSTVINMLQLLKLKKGDRVLEIGTGSGWNTAIMSHLVGEKGRVVSLEIILELLEKAQKRLEKLKLKNIKAKKQNFLEIRQQFDKIIFTAGISSNQEQIIEDFAKKHLKNNGILLCPFQSGPLIILKKQKNKLKKAYTQEEYRFVPLILK